MTRQEDKQTDIVQCRAEALIRWLDDTEAVDNTVGSFVRDMYVKKLNIYTWQSPMTVYSGAAVESHAKCPLSPVKTMNALKRMNAGDEYIQKLNQLMSGEILPLAGFMGLQVHCPLEHETGVITHLIIHPDGVDVEISHTDITATEITNIMTIPISDLGSKAYIGHKHHNFTRWLNISPFGYVYPISFSTEYNTVTIDNCYLYIRTKDNREHIGGRWEGNVLRLYRGTHNPAYVRIKEKLNGVIPYIAAIREYIMPNGMLMRSKA